MGKDDSTSIEGINNNVNENSDAIAFLVKQDTADKMNPFVEDS